MMKKLICLIVVLALAGSAGAATAIWKSGAGDWSVTANWTGSGPPLTSNDVYAFSATSTALSTITINSTTTGGALALFLGQPSSTKPTGVTSTKDQTLLIVNGVMNVTRDTLAQSYKTGSNSTIDIYGTFNAGTNATSALTLAVSSATTAVSTDVVNVRNGGVLNVAVTTGTGTGTLNVGKATGTTGTVNVYSGGTANVKTALTIGATGKVYFENTGIMWIGGNKTTQVAADILAGKIAPMAVEGTTGIEYGYDASKVLGNITGATWIKGVPEPATVALLGLGSLLLITRKRR